MMDEFADARVRDFLAAGSATGAQLVHLSDSGRRRVALGHADGRRRVPLTHDHVFSIACVARLVTAAVVLHVAQRGAVHVDDELGRWLPEAHPDHAGTTLRDLLASRSGVADEVDEEAGDPATALAASVGELLARPRDILPGATAAKSNGALACAARVCEVATGTAWPCLVDGVLRSAGLPGVHLDPAAGRTPPVVAAMPVRTPWPRPRVWAGSASGSSSYASGQELAELAAVLLGVGGRRSPLDAGHAALLTRALSPVVSGSRTGMWHSFGGYTTGGSGTFSVGGWGYGHSTELRVDASRRQVAVLCARGVGVDRFLDEAFPGLRLPAFQPATDVPPQLPAADYAGSYRTGRTRYEVEPAADRTLVVRSRGPLYGSRSDRYAAVGGHDFARPSAEQPGSWRRIRFFPPAADPAGRMLLHVDERIARRLDDVPARS